MEMPANQWSFNVTTSASQSIPTETEAPGRGSQAIVLIPSREVFYLEDRAHINQCQKNLRENSAKSG